MEFARAPPCKPKDKKCWKKLFRLLKPKSSPAGIFLERAQKGPVSDMKAARKEAATKRRKQQQK